LSFFPRHGDNLTRWAICERATATSAPPEVMPVIAEPVDVDDPDLKEAMRLHRLTWAGHQYS
jgi:hypothetical protein